MADEPGTNELLVEQNEYYRTRGKVTDDWFYRRGRYDHGPVVNRQWFREGVELVQAILNFDARGKALVLGAGSGYWTQHLVMTADHVTVIEISPDSIAASKARLGPFTRKVRYIEGDAYQWRPTERYDVIALPFWLTHVPPARFEQFWSFIRGALTPRGRVFLMDNLRTKHGIAIDHDLPGLGERVAIRRRGGREHRVFKTFYTPVSLTERLNGLGWETDLRATREFFLYGSAQRVD